MSRWPSSWPTSSKSVANILSAISVFCHYAKLPWLNSDDLYLREQIQVIRLEDPKPIARKIPIKKAMIGQGLSRYLKVKESMPDLLAATITLLGYNGLLRGDEIFSCIRAKDVTWDHASAKRSSLHIGQPTQPGKTAEDGSGFILKIFDYLGPSAYKYLRAWFDLHNLWSKPESYIFPNVVTSNKGKTVQLLFNECVSKKWYERQLDAMLTPIGEDSKIYSVHSLKAGGATDLFLAGASLAMVQNYGRWISLSALKWRICSKAYYNHNLPGCVSTARIRAVLGILRNTT
jgi:hypothetical protein